MTTPVRGHVEYTASTRQARKELGLMNNEVVRTGRDIRRMAGALRTLGVLTLATTFTKVVGRTAEWNQVLNQTATLLGLNSDETSQYVARMEELSRIALDTAGVTKAQLAGALQQTADRIRDVRGELSPTEATFAVYSEALRLANITGKEFIDTLNLSLLTLERFDLPATRAADVVNLIASSIIVGGKSFDNLARWLDELGPLASDAGFHLEDVLAVLTSFDGDHGVGAVKAATMLRGMAADGDEDAKRLYESMMLALGIDPSQATLLEVVDALAINLRETPGFADALSDAINGAVSEQALGNLQKYNLGLQELRDHRDALSVHAGTGLVPETPPGPPGSLPHDFIGPLLPGQSRLSDSEVDRIARAGQRLADSEVPPVDEAEGRGSMEWPDVFRRNLEAERAKGAAVGEHLPFAPEIRAAFMTGWQKGMDQWNNIWSAIKGGSGGRAIGASGPLDHVGAFAPADRNFATLVLEQAPRGLEGAQAIIDAAARGDEAAKQLVQSLGLVEGPTLSAAEVMATLGMRVQDGTADLGALKAVFDQGIIGQESIAEIVVYAAQAQVLADALRAITREAGTAAEALNRIRPSPVASDFIGPLLPGQQRLPSFGEGGYIPPRAGGHVIRVSEAGEGEYVVPASRMEELLARINAPIASIQGAGRVLASSGASAPGVGPGAAGAQGGAAGDGGLHLHGDIVLPGVRRGDEFARELKREARRREAEANYGQLGTRKG